MLKHHVAKEPAVQISVVWRTILAVRIADPERTQHLANGSSSSLAYRG